MESVRDKYIMKGFFVPSSSDIERDTCYNNVGLIGNFIYFSLSTSWEHMLNHLRWTSQFTVPASLVQYGGSSNTFLDAHCVLLLAMFNPSPVLLTILEKPTPPYTWKYVYVPRGVRMGNDVGISSRSMFRMLDGLKLRTGRNTHLVPMEKEGGQRQMYIRSPPRTQKLIAVCVTFSLQNLYSTMPPVI